MVGCMLVCILAKALPSPRPIRPPMAMVLGLTIGASFSPAFIAGMVPIIPSLLLVLPFTAVVTILGMIYFRNVAGYDRVTAAYCALPGGLSEITLLAEEAKADIRRISLVHAARMAVTIALLSGVFAVMMGPVDSIGGPTVDARASSDLPELAFLLAAGVAAWWLAARFRVPAAPILGPFFLSAILHGSGLVSVAMPPVLVGGAQVVIGATIGCRFVGAGFGELMTIFGHGAAVLMGILLLGLLLAQGVAIFVDQPVSVIVLAFAPGGLTELSLLAIAVGLEASFVATHHLVRQISVVFVAPFMRRLVEPADTSVKRQ